MDFQVAIVEDDREFVSLLQKLLKLFSNEWKKERRQKLSDINFIIEVFDNARFFLEQIKIKCKYDLILVDIVLPGNMTGLTIVEELNRRYEMTSKLAMSAYSKKEILSKFESESDLEGIFQNFSCRFFAKCSTDGISCYSMKESLQLIVEELVLTRLKLRKYEFAKKQLILSQEKILHMRYVQHQIKQHQAAFFGMF